MSLNKNMNVNMNMNMNMGPLGLGLGLGPRQVSSSSSDCSLREILDEAVGIATFKVDRPSEETVMDDVFNSLFRAFGADATEKETSKHVNPFEPTPLPVSSSYSSFGSLEDDWEPFPLF